MSTITEIETLGEGTLVTANGQYAKLAYFNNEFPYYAFVNDHGFTDEELDEAVEVSDFCDDHLDGLQ